MSGKFSFHLKSEDRRRALPTKIIIGQNDTETAAHVLLKLLGYLLFFRDRLQLETNLHQDGLQFIPDIVQTDYQLRAALWVECGECSVTKLDKLAVKVPEAEIWVIKRSMTSAQHLVQAMAKGDLRRNRYSIVALDAIMFDEMLALIKPRNQVFLLSASFDPPQLQLDFNGLWFDAPFDVLRF